MTTFRGQTIKLRPNKTQLAWLYKQTNACKYAYNDAVRRWTAVERERQEAYKNNIPKEDWPANKTSNELRKEVVNHMHQLASTPEGAWLQGVSWTYVHEVFEYRVKQAINRFFSAAKAGKRKQAKAMGNAEAFFPKPKRFGEICTLATQYAEVKDGCLLIRGLARLRYAVTPGQKHRAGIKMSKPLRFPEGTIVTASIFEQGGFWYVSLTQKFETAPAERFREPLVHPIVGADLGTKTLCTIASASEKYVESVHPSPLFMERLERLYRKLWEAQRAFSRKAPPDRKAGTKASKGYYLARRKVARLHAHITNVRKDWIRKTCAHLADTYSSMVIAGEDLHDQRKRETPKTSRAGMKWKNFRKKATKLSPGMFRLSLKWAFEKRGRHFEIANAHAPSTITCSECGQEDPSVTPDVDTWVCAGCGKQRDRKINAAVWLAKHYSGPAQPKLPEESKDSRD